MSKKANAFTIVELLIVIVVIAILAAISIVAYRGIQDRATNSAASAKVAQAVKKIQLYYAEKDEYPSPGDLAAADITDTSGLAYKANNTSNPKTYCVTATVNSKSYYMNNTTATSPTPGGCPGHGQNGVAPITNLAMYPNFTGSGAMANGWSSYNHTSNAITRSASGNVQTFTVTALNTGGRRAGVRHENISLDGSINGKYLSSRIKVDTSGLTSGTRFRLYFDYYYQGVYVTTVSATTTSTSATQVIYPPTLVTQNVDRLSPYAWIETTASADWTGTSTVRISEFSVFVSDTPFTPVYYDGNSPNWDWNGPVNASSSSCPAS